MAETEIPVLRSKFGTFSAGLVQAQTTTEVRIGPGLYALSSSATVPYVSLIGSSGSEKLISWGEIVEVPEHELATIRNASWHAGDVVLQAGRDVVGNPSRVTVPVQLETEIDEDNNVTITPAYVVDCRRARSAFLHVDIQMVGALVPIDVVWTIRGAIANMTLHSHNTETATRLPQYLDGFAVAAGTNIGAIPLGRGVTNPLGPMALLDIAIATLTVPNTAISGGQINAYYSLEYF